MAARQLPANPSLKSLKNQAKQLLHGHQSGAKEACERIRASHPRMSTVAPDAIREMPFALADALVVIAREYGYESWPKLLSEQFSDPTHFANEPGWEWTLSPNLWYPLGSSGTTGSGGCMVAWENQRANRALFVHVAVSDPFVERDLRVIAFDEEAKRYIILPNGSVKSKTLGLFAFALPYSEIPYGVVSHIGIEVREQ